MWSALAPHHAWIQGFYLFNEPFWRNNSTGWDQILNVYLTGELNAASDFMHAESPGIPTIVVFSYVEMNYPDFSSTYYPSHVDWVGFDCYRFEGDKCSEHNVRRLFDKLLTLKTSKQKLILIPDAVVRAANNIADFDLVHRLKLYKDLAAWNPSVVGIFPFQYQSNVSEAFIGAESLPHILNELKIYCRGLIGEVKCLGNDLIIITTNAVEWTNAPVCTPSCEGPWMVRRDADGHQISSAKSSVCY